MKILLTSLFIFLAFQLSFGQELKEGEYWDSWGEGRQPIWYYKTFTKNDAIKANKLFNILKSSIPKHEWEGEYDGFAELGEERLIWNIENGFVKYEFYHTLRRLNYGEITDKNSVIMLVDKSDKATSIKSNLSGKIVSNKLVKVKFGERHFLIPENFLRGFLEMAAGVQTNDEAIYFSWLKVEDMEKTSFGVPQVAAQYKNLVRFPIKARIVKIGKTNIKITKEDEVEYGEVNHFVTINVGREQKVKVGMQFNISELDETATVVKVFPKSSTAKIFRDFYKTRVERCWDEKHELRPCPEIKVGMSAKTFSPFE